MKNTTKAFFAMLLLTAAALLSAPKAGAQAKDDMKQEPKHDKKYVVRILTIEDGDTTVSDHAVDPDADEIRWTSDDGTELTAVFESGDDDDADADMKEDMTPEVLGKEKYREYVLQSGKDGKPMKVFITKNRGEGHGGAACCDGGSCCRMGHMDMKGMHGRMDEKMMRMRDKMDDRMERMHEKMEKKMMWKEKKDNDDDKGDKEDDDDSDDDGDNLP